MQQPLGSGRLRNGSGLHPWYQAAAAEREVFGSLPIVGGAGKRRTRDRKEGPEKEGGGAGNLGLR